MPSVLQYSSAVAALVSSVAGNSFGSIPSQTVGHGLPIFEAMATEAPSLELVKRKLEKKSLTNVCSEWTILGGNGQPQCYNSQTCLFSSAGDPLTHFEGCGMTSIAYDWITECSDYPNTGTAGASQTFCDAAFPSCGIFKFVFEAGLTYSNYGCSTKAYSYVATLLETDSGSVGLAGGSSTLVLTPTATIIITQTPTDKIDGTNIPGQATRTSLPQATSKKSTPIGAIVGGVVGGIAVIALIGFIAWYCLRKRKQDKAAAAAVQQQQADAATAAAYHNTNHMPEIDGTMTMKPGAGAFAPPPNPNYSSPPEKPVAGVAAHEYRPQAQSQYSSGYGSEIDPRGATASPPPLYAHPSPPTQISSPASGYTELDPTQTARQSVQPVSPAGTNTGTFLSTNVSELGGGENRLSYQAYNPSQSTPPVPEMGASTGGINRPAVGRQHPAVDMNGAPMSENYRPHEMP
jgi:hypothetical protein